MPAGSRVFDSWPLIAFLQDEPEAGEVLSLFAEAQASGGSLWITSVNLAEVWYRVARIYSARKADEAINKIRGLGFRVEAIDWDLARLAGDFKARHRLAFADCFAAALAKQRHVELVTEDPEFKQLSKEIAIRWL